jgi:hypothetical protein
MSQTMPFCFSNISTEIQLHSLGKKHFYCVPNFGLLLHYAVAIKSIENCYEKSCSAFVPKLLVKLTPGGQGGPQSPFAKDSRCHNYKPFFIVNPNFT